MSETIRSGDSDKASERSVDAEREHELDQAAAVKEAFVQLGKANGKFSTLCREYLFAHEKALSKKDQQRRFALLDNFEHGGETVGDTTISTQNKMHTLRIAHDGQEYDYVWHDTKQQTVYSGTYPGGDAIDCHASQPANMQGIDHQRFRVATHEDVAQYERAYAEAQQLAAEMESKRTTVGRLIDSMTGKTHQPVYPRRPDETPDLYPAAIRVANDAAAALEAASAAIEHLRNPDLGTLPNRGKQLLEILERSSEGRGDA